MKATIWHNPRCSKSRETLALLHAADAEVTVVEYLKHPLPAAELSRLYALAGLTPHDGLRRSDPGARELDGAPDHQVLAAMERNPIIVERPLVETDRGVRLCRPPELVRGIL